MGRAGGRPAHARGVEVPGPSELPCVRVGGLDWLALAQESARQRLVTFGLHPAYEVAIARTGDLDFTDVLEGLARLITPAQAPAAVCTDRAAAFG
jgi:hypothetical protein